MKLFQLYTKYGLVGLISLALIVLISAFIVYSGSYTPSYDKAFETASKKYSGARLEGNQIYDKESVKVLAKKDASKIAYDEASEEASGTLFTYIFVLIFIGIGLSLILPIVTNISNPKVFIKPAIGIGVLGILLLFCKAFADPTVSSAHIKVSESTLLWSDTLILLAGLVLILGLVAIVVAQLLKLIRNFR